ncbi:MAG: THUMP domain-containing protein, partial [Gemmatimonadota bacterium]|nr:THUMP domain-containing protein [Gemmatimonadota bacterium]
MAQPRPAKRKTKAQQALSAPRAARASASDRLDLFAITAPGLEPLAAGELHALGIADAKAEAGGVSFGGGLPEVYRANLWLRTATRVVARAAEFGARAFYELEKGAKQVAWERWLGGGRPVQIRVTCRKSKLYHSDAVAERVANAIASRATKAGEITARSGGADGEDDDAVQDRADAQLVIVRMLHDRCTISIDTSGALLHRRGYRLATAKAPLRETLAAAALFASAWDPTGPLIDPLCGAGTIAIEAALLARHMAPGAQRNFAFMAWPSFDATAWTKIRDDALASAL